METRKSNANRTDTLTNVVNTLQKTNFHDAMMGSGLLIRITDLDGKPVTPEFSIPAEDMDKIKGPIVDSIKTLLKCRIVMLKSEIRAIEQLHE